MAFCNQLVHLTNTGGKWLIHGTKRHKDNQVWNSPVEYPSRECKHDIKESKGNMFNPIFKENVQGQKHPGICVFAEPELLMLCVTTVHYSAKMVSYTADQWLNQWWSYDVPTLQWPYSPIWAKRANAWWEQKLKIYMIYIDLYISSALREIDPDTAYVVCISVSLGFSYPYSSVSLVLYPYSLVFLIW